MIGPILTLVAVTVAHDKFPKQTAWSANGILKLTAVGIKTAAGLVKATIDVLARLGE